MTHDPSRKRFLAKVLGLAAVGALAPRAAARTLVPAPARTADAKPAGIRLRPQPRAVARRGGPA